MATAPALEKPGHGWHVRGTWSARDDRVSFAVYLGILWAGVIAGFGVDLARFLHQTPAAPTSIRVHAFVFTTWMLLLTAQVLLVLRNRVAWHRRMGWVAAGWACLMAIMGPWAAMASQTTRMHSPGFYPQFLSVNLVDIGGFLVLLAWGIALRRNPAAHKRIMILATVSLADPGFNRLAGWLIHFQPASVPAMFLFIFYGNVVLVLLMAGWDWRRGRLMRQFVVGAAGLLSAEFVAALLLFWGPWRTVTAASVEAWARHFG
jgi:hypothetical protein